MTTVSVVLCTRDRPALLPAALVPLAAALAAVPGTQFVVVQQGDGDAEELCRAAGIDAEVVHDAGVGAARARNIGIRMCRGDIVMFTDDDCEVPESWLAGHLEALRDPEVTATFGVVEGLSRAPGADPVAERRRHVKGTTPWLIGHSANMAARRAALVDVGGFDERLGPGSRHALIGEDADLIVRLLEAGGVCLSGVGEAVQHMGWRTPAEHKKTILRYEAGSGAWIGAAFRRQGWITRRHLRSRLHVLRERSAYEIRTRHYGAAIGGVFSLVRGFAHGLTFRPWPAPLPAEPPTGAERS